MSNKHKTGLPHAAPNALDRRSLLAAAGSGISSASGMLGGFTRDAQAAEKVTRMGLDHPSSFVSSVSDIQRWGMVYAKAHGLTALYTSEDGTLDAKIATL